MNREYLKDHLKIVNKRIDALQNEFTKASLDRAIEINKDISNLEFKRQGLL